MHALPEPLKEANQVREKEGVRVVYMGGLEAFVWSPEI